MNEPAMGASVLIVPNHRRVPLSGNTAGRWLDMEPREVTWSPWWSQRLRDGDIAIVPVSAPAPVSAPPVLPPDTEGN